MSFGEFEERLQRDDGSDMAQQFPTSQGALADYADCQQHRETMQSCPMPQAPQHLSLASLMQAQGAGAPGITMQDLMQLALVNGGAGSPGAAHVQAFAGLQRQPGCELGLPFHVGTSFAAAARHQSPMAPPIPSVHDSPAFLPHLTPSQGSASANSAPPKREDVSESDAEQSDTEREPRGSVNTIFPRRKQGQHARINSQPVILNEATLSQLFTLPLHKAAVKLGISATAMKSACRKLGIKKWPYRALSGNSTKLQRKSRTCSSAGTSSRSRPKSSHSTACSESSAYHSSDLSKDAQLLAETMRLLQQGVLGGNKQCRDQGEEQLSSSEEGSDCDSEVSGASTREGGQQERSQGESSPEAQCPAEQSSPGPSASASSAPPNSVASLLN